MHFHPLGRTDLSLSKLGFGAAPLGDEFGPVDAAEAVRAVHYALDSGISLIDVAPYYGRTLAESRLGAALNGRRHKAVISTKCARFDVDRFDFSAASAKASIDASLKRLGTDYVDIFHVHDIEFGNRQQIIEETIPALREIQQSGKARFIGITGLSLRMLHDVAAAAPVDCVLSYCRYNLLNRDLDTALAPFARRSGTGLISASPLHMGVLSETGPPAWHPAPDPVKAAGREIVALCQTRNVSPSTIALQFALSHPDVSSTLVGMATREQVDHNIEAAVHPPDADLLAEIDAIAAPVRDLMWITGRPENH